MQLQVHELAVMHGRSAYIGGSDATKIAKGEWLDVYNEKKGITKVDLSDVFRVQLGIHTEPLHRRWHAMRESVHIHTFDHPVTSAACPHHFMAVSLDGWVTDFNQAIELKHTNEHNNLRSAAAYYMGQLQHTMLVTGTDQMRFSIIRGNCEPEWGMVSADPYFQNQLLEMEKQFWWHIENNVPPEDTNANLDEAALAVPIDGLKPYDMDTNNEFVSLALDYCASIEGWKQHEDAKKQIKKLVPADASEATCRALTIKRDARGSLRFTVKENA